MNPNTVDVNWIPGWRIIPSRFPPIQLFERAIDPLKLDPIFELESRTNPRLKNEVGELSLVPPDERVVGPGSSIIMVAFTHLNPDGSRFSDGSFGVFYASKSLDTAIAETKFHREQFFKVTFQLPTNYDMRVYRADIIGNFHDIRNQHAKYSDLYLERDYRHSSSFAKRLRNEGSDGIVYNSVRDKSGECIAVFRANKVSNVLQERHLLYEWDGEKIKSVEEISSN